jgi:hypothetical protein
MTNLVEGTSCLVAARELQKILQILHKDDLSPTVISAHFIPI